MGPTASGKTEIASRLFEHMECELVSVDAAQVYRGMNIGTAKPDAEFLARTPHHLIDIRKISETYSAADFSRDANRLIADIIRRRRVPVLVGGTMFYFSALEQGLSALPAADPVLRMQVRQEVREHGLAVLYEELAAADRETACRLSPADSQRIQRAIEVLRLTGVPPSQLMHRARNALEQPVIKLAVFAGDRGILHHQIGERFRAMLELGLVEEVRALAAEPGFAASLPALRSVGYRQVLAYLDGKVSYSAMVENGQAATRQLAKRQLTWLRNQSNLVWFENSQPKVVESMIDFLRGTMELGPR
ncbi:MAG: tRNA (adenosine(37)-N6)-dimethylallyltransferase MiaA [Gammaproteobacteria bacterium]|nr:tRNA (adenosine(37)-N6)-dimethylallyltransferase MiaA [Gammaproteobacteria bacterium]